MLNVKDLNVYYGAIHALHGVCFSVSPGEIVSLIGANGAGKTTILQSISGILKASSGEVTFEGKNLLNMQAHNILKTGLSQVPEGRRIFPGLTVAENLLIGAYARRDKEKIKEDLAGIYKRFPRLGERKKQYAGTLSGGEQQMLAMGRALMSRPKMLLLDEPSMGLSPILVKEIFNIVKDVNESGVTILLVEQNAKMALSIADRAYVIETGRIVLSGNAKDLLSNEDVKKAYLGA